MGKLLIHFLLFLKVPVDEPLNNQNIRSKTRWLFYLLIIEFPFIVIASAIQHIPGIFGFVDMDEHSLVEFINDTSIFEIFILGVFFGPFIEELIFRLPLRIKRGSFVPVISLFATLLGFFAIRKATNTAGWIYLLPILVGAIVFALMFNKKLFEKLSAFIHLYYRTFFYSVALIFALYHLTNFEYSIYLLLFSPLLILPQFIAGLFLGFMRIRLGFFWGYFFHALHNAILLLPALLFLADTNPNTKFEKDGYSFELKEGLEKNSKSGQINHEVPNVIITIDEVELNDSFENVVSSLTQVNKRGIRFQNPGLANKKISLYFRNDSAFTSAKTDSARYYALQNLLDTYGLKITEKERWALIWKISVYDSTQFLSHIVPVDTIKIPGNIQYFYGPKDTLDLNEINSEYLCRELELNFNIDVENSVDEGFIFDIRIPNTKYQDLKRHLKSNYGLRLTEIRKKRLFKVVE